MRKIATWIVTLSMCLCVFSFAAFASLKQQLQIVYTDAGKALENAAFSVYYLGDVNNGKIIPDARFSSYKVSFDISDSENLKKLADTLSAYIIRDNLNADYTDNTDKNGIADFDSRAFHEGAYLITAEKYHNGKIFYICEPVIAVLPYGNSNVLKINPKFETVPDDKVVSYKVLKVWVGDDKYQRPAEIVVELLCDGKVYSSVILNAENNWKYQWSDLSPEYNWTVAEKDVPGNYTVSLSVLENTFLLTNTGNTSEDEPTSPDDTTSPDGTTSPDNTTSPDGTTSPDNTTLPDGPTSPDDTTSPDSTTAPLGTTSPTGTTKPNDEEQDKIPVTGALRWPVPYLAMAGVLLFIIGYVQYRKSELEDE